jgi:hypothetical protein
MRARAPPPVPIRLQTQLRVSAPADAAEVEAQEIGRRVARMPAPSSRGAPPLRREGPRSVQRRAAPQTMVSGPVVRGLEATRASGVPLPQPVRTFMEPRFGADFSGVRVHTGREAAALSTQLNAHAFTVDRDLYFNDGQFRPDSLEGRELIAHELAHTIQQGGVIQRAAAEAPVVERSGEDVQRSIWDDIKNAAGSIVNALGDPLNFLADKANLIPGFRLFTIVLGANPINMAKVDPTPANILMALIEFIPGGGFVTQALQSSGVFDKVGAWIADKIKALVSTVSAIKAAVTAFINSLKVTDLADPGGVWDRAKRIFTEPIDRLISFAKGVITDILKFIKDAILIPLAKLAEGTDAWPLLTAVLGKNPVTDEPVEPKPDVLIGGFMKLIGQEEVWQNVQKANAVTRVFSWFKGAVPAVKGFVSAIPGKFKELFSALTIEDVVLVAGAFKKVAAVFGGFVGDFVSWGLKAVWDLLEIVFDAVSPGASEYVKKTADALHDILKNPLPFVGNLVKAAKLGLQNFANNIGTHLKNGLIAWLTGEIPDVYIPNALSLVEIGKFALSVLGLTWTHIRSKIVKALGPTGETIMKGLEAAFDIVKALVTGGPAAAWEVIKEKLTELKDQVLGELTGFVKDTIVEKAIPQLLALFIPGAGFVGAIISIYSTVKSFVEQLARVAAAIKAFVDSIVAIAKGEITGAAQKVESALANVLPVAIAMLAGFLKLGAIPAKIKGVITKIRAPVDKALDTAITWIIGQAKALFASLFGGKDGKPDARTPEQKMADLQKGVSEARALLDVPNAQSGDIKKRLPPIKQKYRLTTLELVKESKQGALEKDHIHGAVNPDLSSAPGSVLSDDDLQILQAYTGPYLFAVEEVVKANIADKSLAENLIKDGVAKGKVSVLKKRPTDSFTDRDFYSFDASRASISRYTNKRNDYGFNNSKIPRSTEVAVLNMGLDLSAYPTAPMAAQTSSYSWHESYGVYVSVRSGAKGLKFDQVAYGHKGNIGASDYWNSTGHTQTSAQNQAWNNDPSNYHGPEGRAESAGSGAAAELYRVPARFYGSNEQWL